MAYSPEHYRAQRVANEKARKKRIAAKQRAKQQKKHVQDVNRPTTRWVNELRDDLKSIRRLKIG